MAEAVAMAVVVADAVDVVGEEAAAEAMAVGESGAEAVVLLRRPLRTLGP